MSRKAIGVALQGGGSHCAFAWGVLDTLLEDSRLEFESLSGTSGGAINAVAVADGFARGGAEDARASLARFWGHLDRENPALAEADEILDTVTAMFNPWVASLPQAAKTASNYFAMFNPWAALPELLEGVSPYAANPFALNPMIGLLESVFDFEAVRRSKSPKLFVSATNVYTGAGRVFRSDEIDAKTVMASACLPSLFQAVEIDEHAYWDGGYTANPMLWPLTQETTATDIVLIRIIPLQTATLPQAPHEIIGRLHQIIFNTSLQQELRQIHFINQMLREKRLDPKRHKMRHIHCIDGTEYISSLPAGSMYDISPRVLHELRDAGREIARTWLSKHHKDIGRRSTHEPDDAQH